MTMTASEDYAARLARVQANKGRSVIMVGRDDSFVHERAQIVQISRGRELAGNISHPASLVGAFGLGMLAVALGYYARFHLMSGHSELPDADLEMALSAIIGLCIAFALSQMFRITSKSHKAMQSAGVVLMICSFHNLAFWVPGAMALAFSPEFVQEQQLTALPNSVRFRGIYIPLGADLATDLAETDPDAPPSAAEGSTDCAVAATAPAATKLELTGERRKSVEAAPKPAAPCP